MKSAKSVLAILLVLCLSLSITPAAFAESAVATAHGLDETVTVTLSVEDGVITDVKAETDKADSPIGAQAIEKLPAAMLEQNSVKVDAVSGATMTSNAILAAAAEAYLRIAGTEVDLDAWARGNGYLKASVEYVLDPADLTLFGSSESNTAKLNNMNVNPNVDLYWTRQIRVGDICSEAMPVLPSYFMSYGVELTGTYKPIRFAELSEEEIPVYIAKAHYYFETLDTTAQLAAMDNDALYQYLCASPMNFYQIVPTRIVVTSPWFLNVYDSGYARQFVDDDLQAKLLAAVQEKYPEAASLTTLDFATFSATGLKTQQVMNFEG